MIIHFIFVILLCLSIIVLVDQTAANSTNNSQFLSEVYIDSDSINEDYDPGLSRLKSVNDLLLYTDSLYYSKGPVPFDSAAFANLFANVIRKKFYHGYSYYGSGNNLIASRIARFFKSDVNAIVIPDDIVKRPMAACSQQSIVLMTGLKSRGYSVRKVVFFDSDFGGHFCVEVKYGDNWHYYDTDLEIDQQLANKHNRPGIAAIVADNRFLHKIYKDRLDSTDIDKLFPTYSYGQPDVEPAPRALIFQRVTKALTYSGVGLTILAWFLTIFLANRHQFSKA